MLRYSRHSYGILVLPDFIRDTTLLQGFPVSNSSMYDSNLMGFSLFFHLFAVTTTRLQDFSVFSCSLYSATMSCDFATFPVLSFTAVQQSYRTELSVFFFCTSHCFVLQQSSGIFQSNFFFCPRMYFNNLACVKKHEHLPITDLFFYPHLFSFMTYNRVLCDWLKKMTVSPFGRCHLR